MSATTVAAPSRAASIAAWSLQGLLAAAFFYFGISKLIGGESIVAAYDDIGAGQWLRYATATTEIAGAVALLYRPLAGLAALALTLQMAGAAVTQVGFTEDGSPVTPIVLGILAITVAALRRDEAVETLRRIRFQIRPIKH